MFYFLFMDLIVFLVKVYLSIWGVVFSIIFSSSWFLNYWGRRYFIYNIRFYVNRYVWNYYLWNSYLWYFYFRFEYYLYVSLFRRVIIVIGRNSPVWLCIGLFKFFFLRYFDIDASILYFKLFFIFYDFLSDRLKYFLERT